MMNGNDKTSPTRIQPETPAEVKPQKPLRGIWILLGILVLMIGGGVGAAAGYQVGVQQRLLKSSSQVALAAATQFQLGEQDQTAGRFAIARQRYEYVIKLDPKFPGAQEKLTEVMVVMMRVDTPTPMPSPTPSPTPDLRGVEELLNSARAALAAGDWTKTMDTLDSMRKADIHFHAVDGDGMYYIALRNRGIDKILKDGNLEGGIYDLTLSERFAPLDNYADGFRNWSRIYLQASAFWGVDWPKVVDMLGQVYTYLPNLRDGSGMTASERYRIATIKAAEVYEAKSDYCTAVSYYQLALGINLDPKVMPKATQAEQTCHPATATAKPFTATPTGILTVVSTIGNTVVPTLGTPVPTETPTPSAMPKK